ncbi:MAG: hypothetical protein HZC28_06630 [Spirochaetes bacterium]|nr:hypothetical protein [Spirochaetota bacterium]
MDQALTQKVKAYAREIGSDLVGISNIGRWAKAPIMMSPQGILPTAKAIVVCAVHHPDAAVELGGMPSPQDIGPYAVQYTMNNRLDLISFKIGRYLDDLGYKTVPIASSNIWRYRPYKELTAVFAPDMSHIYSPVTAGLADLGWNGLALTPEFGARNRFISIITEAELVPDPLLEPGSVCDKCMDCVRHCPTDAYRKEVNGVNVLEIEDKKYKFCNKNLWRCAWGEHFDLDLDLKIPEKVDEAAIIDNVKKHGIRGGEMGSCLRWCLPKNLRVSEPSYTDTWRRKRHVTPNYDVPVHRDVIDKVIEIGYKSHYDFIGFNDEQKIVASGINVKEFLPDGRSAIVVGMKIPLPAGVADRGTLAGRYGESAGFWLKFAAYDITRYLERLGYSAVMDTKIDSQKLAAANGFTASADDIALYTTIVTSANFTNETFDYSRESVSTEKMSLNDVITSIAKDADADLVGFSSAKRLDGLVEQLRGVKENEEVLIAKDKNTRFMTFEPEITAVKRKLRSTGDYFSGAKNVIVLGIHFPEAVVERAEKPPAEAVGPYVFTAYQTYRMLGMAGVAVTKKLAKMGYKAAWSYDLIGIASQVGNPRGYIADATAGAFEAMAAGLGELTYNGTVNTKEFGINQRFVAIVTDAPVEETPVSYKAAVESTCAKCGKCLSVCPAAALYKNKAVQLSLDGGKVTYVYRNTKKCDWSCKYALCGEDGMKFIGAQTKYQKPPENVDANNLAEALRGTDPIQKYRPVTAESCIIHCPLANGDKI